MESIKPVQETNKETLTLKLEKIKAIEAIVEDYIDNGPNENQGDYNEKDFFLNIGRMLTEEEIRIRKSLKE